MLEQAIQLQSRTETRVFARQPWIPKNPVLHRQHITQCLESRITVCSASNDPYSQCSQCSPNSFLSRDTPSILIILFLIKSNRGKTPEEEVVRRENKSEEKRIIEKHLRVASHGRPVQRPVLLHITLWFRVNPKVLALQKLTMED